MRKGQNSRKIIIFAVTIFLVTSALSGCTGDKDEGTDQLVGIWYEDDSQSGLQFTDTEWIPLEDGLTEGIGGGLFIQETYSWSTNGNVISLRYSSMAADTGGKSYTCDDNSTIPLFYVNDGEGDCENGEDEGVDPETLDVEYNISVSITYDWKYEMTSDDVMFFGILGWAVTEDGNSQSYSVSEDNVCGDEGECFAMIRSSALAGAQHATVLNEVDAPEWWADTMSELQELF